MFLPNLEQPLSNLAPVRSGWPWMLLQSCSYRREVVAATSTPFSTEHLLPAFAAAEFYVHFPVPLSLFPCRAIVC